MGEILRKNEGLSKESVVYRIERTTRFFFKRGEGCLAGGDVLISFDGQTVARIADEGDDYIAEIPGDYLITARGVCSECLVFADTLPVPYRLYPYQYERCVRKEGGGKFAVQVFELRDPALNVVEKRIETVDGMEITGDVILEDCGNYPDNSEDSLRFIVTPSRTQTEEGSSVTVDVIKKEKSGSEILIGVVGDSTLSPSEYGFYINGALVDISQPIPVDTDSLQIEVRFPDDTEVEDAEILHLQITSSNGDVEGGDFYIEVTDNDVALPPEPKDFISDIDGVWADGATWGNDSPGIAGVDFPRPTDIAHVRHHVTVPESTVEAGNVLVDDSNGRFDVQGEFTMNSDIVFSNGSSIVNDGVLNLNGNDLKAIANIRRFDLDSNGGTFNGPGNIGSNFPMMKAAVSEATFDGITGFHMPGNRSWSGVDAFDSSIVNSRFVNCSGECSLLNNSGYCVEGKTCTVDHVYFDGFNKIFAGSNAGTENIHAEACVFDAIKGFFPNKSLTVENCVFNDTPVLYGGSHMTGVLFTAINSEGSYTPAHLQQFYMYSDKPNPHSFHVSDPKSVHDFTIEGGVVELVAESGDGCDTFILGEFNDSQGVNFRHNIQIDNTGGVFINALGSEKKANVVVSGNIVYVNSKGSGYYGHLIRNETGGSFNKITNIENNIVCSFSSPNPYSTAVYMLNNSPDQIESTDNNIFWNLATPYVGVSITGKTEGDIGFGANDRAIDPGFTDPTRNLASYDAMKGGDGTAAHAISEFVKIAEDGTDYSIVELIDYVREGFVSTAL